MGRRKEEKTANSDTSAVLSVGGSVWSETANVSKNAKHTEGRLGSAYFTLPLVDMSFTLLMTEEWTQDLVWAVELAEMLSLSPFESNSLRAMSTDKVFRRVLTTWKPANLVANDILDDTRHPHHVYTVLNLIEVSPAIIPRIRENIESLGGKFHSYSNRLRCQYAFQCARFGDLSLCESLSGSGPYSLLGEEGDADEGKDGGKNTPFTYTQAMNHIRDAMLCGAAAGGHLHLFRMLPNAILNRQGSLLVTPHGIHKPPVVPRCLDIHQCLTVLDFVSLSVVGAGGGEALPEFNEKAMDDWRRGVSCDVRENEEAGAPPSPTHSSSSAASLCELFLSNGFDNTEAGSALVRFAGSNQSECVRVLLLYGCDANFALDEKKAQLLATSEVNMKETEDEDKVGEEEDSDACVRVRSSGTPVAFDGRDTALTAAAASGNSSICTMLLKHGAQISEYSLVVPASHGHWDIVELLLRHSVGGRTISPNLRLEKESPLRPHLTLLHYAARNGNVSMIDFLADRGAIIDALAAAAPHAGSPIFQAAKFGEIECVKRLLALGADPNLGNSAPQGHDCLRWAVKRGDLKLLDVLLKNGAQFQVGDECSAPSKNNKKNTSTTVVTKGPPWIPYIVDALLLGHNQKSVLSGAEQTATLHKAVAMEKASSGGGNVPTMRVVDASDECVLELVETILNCGVPPDVKSDSSSTTPVMKTNSRSVTALDLAVERVDRKISSVLRKFGAFHGSKEESAGGKHERGQGKERSKGKQKKH